MITYITYLSIQLRYVFSNVTNGYLDSWHGAMY